MDEGPARCSVLVICPKVTVLGPAGAVAVSGIWLIRSMLLRARASGVKTVLWGHGYSKHEAPWRAWPRRKVASLADAVRICDV